MSEETAGNSSPENPDTSLEKDVLDELGDDKLQEIAGLLGTDAAGAQDVVGTTVTALSGNLQEKAEDPAEAAEVQHAFDEATPPQDIAGFGGFGGFGGLAAGGMLSGVLAKMSRPVANAVAKKTGLPVASVTRVIELLIPVLLTVLTKRARTSPKPGGAGAGASGGGIGDLLNQILGGKKR